MQLAQHGLYLRVADVDLQIFGADARYDCFHQDALLCRAHGAHFVQQRAAEQSINRLLGGGATVAQVAVLDVEEVNDILQIAGGHDQRLRRIRGIFEPRHRQRATQLQNVLDDLWCHHDDAINARISRWVILLHLLLIHLYDELRRRGKIGREVGVAHAEMFWIGIHPGVLRRDLDWGGS